MPMTKGKFCTTCYFHAGRFSFSTPGWWVLKEAKKDSLDSKLEKLKDKDKEEVSSEVSFLKWADSQKIKDVLLTGQLLNILIFQIKSRSRRFVPYALNPPVNFLKKQLLSMCFCRRTLWPCQN
jgi:hypothetical protein